MKKNRRSAPVTKTGLKAYRCLPRLSLKAGGFFAFYLNFARALQFTDKIREVGSSTANALGWMRRDVGFWKLGVDM